MMMTIPDKYINPLTDFGFKKLFGSEPNKDLLIDFLNLFEAAEIAKFTSKEREAYQSSLKYYRDIKNVVDTSKEEGRLEGREEGRLQERKEIARNMKVQGISVEVIAQVTGLEEKDIDIL